MPINGLIMRTYLSLGLATKNVNLRMLESITSSRPLAKLTGCSFAKLVLTAFKTISMTFDQDILQNYCVLLHVKHLSKHY